MVSNSNKNDIDGQGRGRCILIGHDTYRKVRQSNDLDSINFCSGGSGDGTLGREETTGG